MYHLVLIVFGLKLWSCSCRYWHVINSSLAALSYSSNENYSYSQNSLLTELKNSWNINEKKRNKFDQSKLNNDFLYFQDAYEIIYNHQHPADCVNSKFFISKGYTSGFASEFHVEGMVLAIAMQMNRILVPFPSRDSLNSWQTPNSICNDVTTLGCYFEPWTNCSWKDVEKALKKNPAAVRNIDKNIVFSIGGKLVDKFKMSDEIKKEYTNNKKILNTVIEKKYSNENVLSIFPGLLTDIFQFLIPYQLNNITKKLPINENRKYYWWRGVSTAFLFKPNNKTTTFMKHHSIQNFEKLNGQCISMYIRHGDKKHEMQLVPFENYAKTALFLWDKNFSNKKLSDSVLNHEIPQKTIILGTETPQILFEAIQWGRKNNWKILFNPLQFQIFESNGFIYPLKNNKNDVVNNVSSQSFFQQKEEFFQNFNKPTSTSSVTVSNTQQKNHHHPKEYLSMIINLSDLMKCDAFVCTLRSNYCRLLDEFRALVGQKPWSDFADLSVETCAKPPCVHGKNIIDFDW